MRFRWMIALGRLIAVPPARGGPGASSTAARAMGGKRGDGLLLPIG
jgi:hypothetical protein